MIIGYRILLSTFWQSMQYWNEQGYGRFWACRGPVVDEGAGPPPGAAAAAAVAAGVGVAAEAVGAARNALLFFILKISI